MTDHLSPSHAGRQPVWLHYHVPKTGGQTLRAVFMEHLRLGLSYAHLTRASDLSYPRTNDDLVAMSAVERRQIVVAGGHAVDQETRQIFDDRPTRELVVVRDAANRIESLYNYRVRQFRESDAPVRDFESWHAETPRNSMTRFLSRRLGVPHDVGAIVDRMAECDLVAATENMDDWLPYLLRQLGLPDAVPERVNVSGVHHEKVFALDDRTRDLVLSAHPRDVRLMDRLVPLLDEHLAMTRAPVPDEQAAKPVRVAEPPRRPRSDQPGGDASPTDVPPIVAPEPGRSLLATIRSSRSRKVLQGGALAAWAVSSVVALASRSAWAIAIAAVVTGAIALVALKVGLVAASQRSEPNSAWRAEAQHERRERQRLAARLEALEAANASTATEADVAETAFAQRQLLFGVRGNLEEDTASMADRFRLMEQTIEPLIAVNQAQAQELVGLREQLARSTEAADRPVNASEDDPDSPPATSA